MSDIRNENLCRICLGTIERSKENQKIGFFMYASRVYIASKFTARQNSGERTTTQMRRCIIA